MMKYNISYEKRCLKYLKRLDKNTQLRILKAINNLPIGDVKSLQGEIADLHGNSNQLFLSFVYK